VTGSQLIGVTRARTRVTVLYGKPVTSRHPKGNTAFTAFLLLLRLSRGPVLGPEKFDGTADVLRDRPARASTLARDVACTWQILALPQFVKIDHSRVGVLACWNFDRGSPEVWGHPLHAGPCTQHGRDTQS